MRSLIAADRACASRDTYSIYEDFKTLRKLDLVFSKMARLPQTTQVMGVSK